ncbi:MAG: hypothetical protein LBL74_03590 [Bacteroidales bacterium]|jgi:hypothetical protein|nr:hypothetical protein [Bacteroidales bacterium]
MFKKDNIFAGAALGLVLTLIGAAVVYLTLMLLDKEPLISDKAFIFSFIPPILLLRYYAKRRFHNSFKGIILILLAAFIAFMYVLYR